MTDNHFYTIGELAEAANTTPRTIRYYTAEGLLPPPDARGRYALYSRDHLARLHLIARLKEAYLPLHEIRTRIAPLATEQVQQLLGEDDNNDPAPSSAADYITSLLHDPRPPATPASMPPAPGPAMHLREAPQPYHSKPVAPSFQLGYHAPQAASRETPSRKATPPQFHAEHSADGEHWRRITLAPGVELHLRAPLASEVQERVAQLIEMARTLFK